MKAIKIRAAIVVILSISTIIGVIAMWANYGM